MASKTNQSDLQLMRCSKCFKVMFENHFNGHVLSTDPKRVCSAVKRAFPKGLTAVDFKHLNDESRLTDQAILDKIRAGFYEHQISKSVVTAFANRKFQLSAPLQKTEEKQEKLAPTPVKKSPPIPKATVVATVPLPSPSPPLAPKLAPVTPPKSPPPTAPVETIAHRLRGTRKRQNAVSYAAYFCEFDDDSGSTSNKNKGKGKTIMPVRASKGSSSESSSEESSFKPQSSDLESLSERSASHRISKPEQTLKKNTPAAQEQRKPFRFTGPLPAFPAKFTKPNEPLHPSAEAVPSSSEKNASTVDVAPPPRTVPSKSVATSAPHPPAQPTAPDQNPASICQRHSVLIFC